MARSGAARIFAVALLAGLALVPLLAALLGQPFWITLFTRILIFALAATGRNLVLGFGGPDFLSLDHTVDCLCNAILARRGTVQVNI